MYLHRPSASGDIRSIRAAAIERATWFPSFRGYRGIPTPSKSFPYDSASTLSLFSLSPPSFYPSLYSEFYSLFLSYSVPTVAYPQDRLNRVKEFFNYHSSYICFTKQINEQNWNYFRRDWKRNAKQTE